MKALPREVAGHWTYRTLREKSDGVHSQMRWYLHGNLVSGISAHHVLDGKSPTRVLVEPAIQAKNTSLIDDNEATSSDQSLDLGPVVYLALKHGDCCSTVDRVCKVSVEMLSGDIAGRGSVDSKIKSGSKN